MPHGSSLLALICRTEQHVRAITGKPHGGRRDRCCRRANDSSAPRPKEGSVSVKKLATLSWRARGSGSTCTAQVDQPIHGYKLSAKTRSNPFAFAGSEGAVPTVCWISFDGETYWVRLSPSQGWPRTIRVTQGDVDGVRL
jgi:hypothetical protein